MICRLFSFFFKFFRLWRAPRNRRVLPFGWEFVCTSGITFWVCTWCWVLVRCVAVMQEKLTIAYNKHLNKNDKCINIGNFNQHSIGLLHITFWTPMHICHPITHHQLGVKSCIQRALHWVGFPFSFQISHLS